MESCVRLARAVLCTAMHVGGAHACVRLWPWACSSHGLCTWLMHTACFALCGFPSLNKGWRIVSDRRPHHLCPSCQRPAQHSNTR